MINSVKRFLKIKENTNCTFSIIIGISYIFKHNQQSHIWGVNVSEAIKIFIYYFTFLEKAQQPAIHQFLQYFWKLWEQRNWSVVTEGHWVFALYEVDTRAIFGSMGNTPCENDMLVRRVKGVAIWSEIHFNPLDTLTCFNLIYVRFFDME